MRLFEFLMVLVSIIIGLGIAEVLTGIARALRAGDSIRKYWVHTILVISIFIAQIQIWWESWGLREAPEWSFPGLLLMLAGPVCLFLMAHLLFPEQLTGSDLRKYYYGAMRPFWLLGAIAVIAATSFRPLIFEESILSTDNVTSLLILFCFAALLRFKRPVLHSVLVPVVLLLLLVDILRWSFMIGDG